MKETPKRSGRRAKTEIYVSEDQQFLAEQMARPRQARQSSIEGEAEGLSSGGVVTHTPTNTVTMYKPTPQGFMPRTVPVTSIPINLAAGWKRVCPDCAGHHGSNPNECPGREGVAYRICPVCPTDPEPHRVYDNRIYAYDPANVDTSDPNFIQDEAYAATTPAQRTKAALDWHIWNRHPQEAREMGLPPISQPPLQKVPELLQGPERGIAPMIETGAES